MIIPQERRGVNINTDDGARHKITQICKPRSGCVGDPFFFSQIVQGKKIRLLSWVQWREEGKKALKWSTIIKIRLK